ncbi:MAG: hypothetical protein ACRD7E_20550 [Bryobacteraceae bacterium]
MDYEVTPASRAAPQLLAINGEAFTDAVYMERTPASVAPNGCSRPPRRWVALSTIDVEPVLLPVSYPASLKDLELLGSDNAEPMQATEHRANADVRFRPSTNMSALRALKHGRANLPVRSHPLKRGI